MLLDPGGARFGRFLGYFLTNVWWVGFTASSHNFFSGTLDSLGLVFQAGYQKST